MNNLVAHKTGVERTLNFGSKAGTYHGIRCFHASSVAKRALDVVGALVLICLLGPLMLIIAVALATGGDAVLFRHPRVGLRGKVFFCLKFRTMRPDADIRLQELLASSPEMRREWESTQKIRNDPRVTKLGKFLRRCSLDELPQLLNVVAGDMSLVGPRPVTAGELEQHYTRLGAAEKYTTVRPGITGLWQVSGRSDTSYDSRVALDERYIDLQSISMDLRILVRTALVVSRRNGAV